MAIVVLLTLLETEDINFWHCSREYFQSVYIDRLFRSSASCFVVFVGLWMHDFDHFHYHLKFRIYLKFQVFTSLLKVDIGVSLPCMQLLLFTVPILGVVLSMFVIPLEVSSIY